MVCESENIGKIEYKDFMTTVRILSDVKKEVLTKQSEVDLTRHIRGAREWYEREVFRYVPDRSVKKLDLIYCGVIEKAWDHESLEVISKKLDIKKTDILFDGATPLPGTHPEILLRWIVIESKN